MALVAADLSSGGGVNKVIRDLAVIFSERLSYDVRVVNGRSDREPSYPFPPQVTVEPNRGHGILSYLKALWRLRRSRPDVVVGFWTQDNILIAIVFLLSRTKIVLAEHGSWHHHSIGIRLLRRAIYPLAWRVVVINTEDLRHYRRYLRRVRIIPNPIKGASAKARISGSKLVLAVGHLTPLKNFQDAVIAMAHSGLEVEGWSLAIIGSGPCEAELRQLISRFELRRTHIHPPSSEIGSWYAKAALLLQPSWIEAAPLVLAEAMNAGVIPVAYATDGASFILEQFPEQLVSIGDVEALTERLAQLANEPNLEPLRARLADSVHSRFSPAVVAEQWRELLTESATSTERGS